MLLVAGVLGWKSWPQTPQVIGPGGVLLGPDPERPGRLAATGHLEPLASLAGRLLPIAVLPLLSFTVALAAEEAEAAEGVAVQPDGRPQIGQGVGVVSQGSAR